MATAKAKRRQQQGAPQVTVDPALCKRCGICVELCPRDVLESAGDAEPAVARPADCTACRICELHCPDFAIRVEDPAGTAETPEEEA